MDGGLVGDAGEVLLPSRCLERRLAVDRLAFLLEIDVAHALEIDRPHVLRAQVRCRAPAFDSQAVELVDAGEAGDVKNLT